MYFNDKIDFACKIIIVIEMTLKLHLLYAVSRKRYIIVVSALHNNTSHLLSILVH